MKTSAYIWPLLMIFLLSSCSALNIGKQVRCTDGKSKIKSKSFKSAKRNKPVNSTASLARNNTSQQSSQPVQPSPRDKAMAKLSSTYSRNSIQEDLTKVNEEEETLSLDELVEFIPYYDVYLDPERANEKLDEVVVFLNEHPTYNATVKGNAAWYQKQDHQIDDLGQEIPLIFGKSREVYSQVLRVYLNPEHSSLLAKSGRNNYKEIRVGSLINARALAIKQSLVAKGVDANRIGLLLGDFSWIPK